LGLGLIVHSAQHVSAFGRRLGKRHGAFRLSVKSTNKKAAQQTVRPRMGPPRGIESTGIEGQRDVGDYSDA